MQDTSPWIPDDVKMTPRKVISAGQLETRESSILLLSIWNPLDLFPEIAEHSGLSLVHPNEVSGLEWLGSWADAMKPLTGQGKCLPCAACHSQSESRANKWNDWVSHTCSDCTVYGLWLGEGDYTEKAHDLGA